MKLCTDVGTKSFSLCKAFQAFSSLQYPLPAHFAPSPFQPPGRSL